MSTTSGQYLLKSTLWRTEAFLFPSYFSILFKVDCKVKQAVSQTSCCRPDFQPLQCGKLVQASHQAKEPQIPKSESWLPILSPVSKDFQHIKIFPSFEGLLEFWKLQWWFSEGFQGYLKFLNFLRSVLLSCCKNMPFLLIIVCEQCVHTKKQYTP